MNRKAIIIIAALSMLVGAGILSPFWMNTSSKLTAKVAECDLLINQHTADSASIAALQESSTNKDNSNAQLQKYADSLFAQIERSRYTIANLKQGKKELEDSCQTLQAKIEQHLAEINLLGEEFTDFANSARTREENQEKEIAELQRESDQLNTKLKEVLDCWRCEHNRGWFKRLFDAGKCPIPNALPEGY